MIWTMSVALLYIVTCFGDASTPSLKRIERQSQSDENAAIEARHGCKCVKYILCAGNNDIDIYGDNIFEKRSKLPTKIPCKGGTFPNEILCCNQKNTGTTRSRVTRLPEDVTCGFQNTGVRDENLAPIDGEFPWVAAIYKTSNTGKYELHCSGTLIHPKVVLTANHCVVSKEPSALTVVVNGKTNCFLGTSTPDERSGVSEIIKHPKYNSGARYYDAALLILDRHFAVGGQGLINTLCLPPDKFDLEGVRCIVAGWAKNEQNVQILKKATVPFVNHDQCQTLLRKTRLGLYFNLDQSFMCAGGEEGRGACTGSGGSPLMCSIPSWSSQYSQVGIVSWAIGCGMKDVPGVYTSIGKVAEWINSELQNRSLKI
ncbi:trypsin 3A1 [Anoplophora glabripennis]|uniref:trypsin 3A1 n=1 Tax=Anoplophora glabripennis TaxID=217634 RepID=UPI0008738996|nr:trypsin 3A1 [Anoplophora glabripennis]